MLWGICLRVVFGLHATWLVNSATHMWGAPPFRYPRRFAQQLVGGAASPSAKAGTTTTTRIPLRPATDLPGMNSIISWIQIKMLRFFGIAEIR